jgi:DNA (cytosine-5)-methyltransferase 1
VSVPTPTATDVAFDKPGLSRKITKESPNRGVGLALWAHRIDDGFYELLRTPAASEAERGHQPEEKARARGGQVTLSGQINFGRDRFNRFEPAVKRWEEVTGMEAPNPTKPDGKDGGQRLSSEFTEWMMGLEPGWVTGHGLSRKDELKACGNGVVPQQAKLALEILLGRIS